MRVPDIERITGLQGGDVVFYRLPFSPKVMFREQQRADVSVNGMKSGFACSLYDIRVFLNSYFCAYFHDASYYLLVLVDFTPAYAL
jgi:hypothetical protein